MITTGLPQAPYLNSFGCIQTRKLDLILGQVRIKNFFSLTSVCTPTPLHTLLPKCDKKISTLLRCCFSNIAPSVSNISPQTKMKNVLLFFLSETFSQALVKSLTSIGHPPVSGQIFVVLGKPSDFEQIGNIRAILFTTVKASIDYVNNVIPF